MLEHFSIETIHGCGWFGSSMLLAIIPIVEAEAGFLVRRGFSEDKGGLIWWWRVRGAAIAPCLLVISD